MILACVPLQSPSSESTPSSAVLPLPQSHHPGLLQRVLAQPSSFAGRLLHPPQRVRMPYLSSLTRMDLVGLFVANPRSPYPPHGRGRDTRHDQRETTLNQ